MNLPICINSLKDDEGHDDSHYLCDVQNFRVECAIQGLPEEEALVLIPDENDAFSYRQLLMARSPPMMVLRTPSGPGSLVHFPLAVQTHYHVMVLRLGN